MTPTTSQALDSFREQMTRLDELIARINDPTWESPPEMLELAGKALEGLKHAVLDDAWAARLAADVADAND